MFISYNLFCDSKSCLKSPKRKPHWPISAVFRPAELQSSSKSPRVSNWYIWYRHFRDHENGPSIPNQVWLQQISFWWLGALRVVMHAVADSISYEASGFLLSATKSCRIIWWQGQSDSQWSQDSAKMSTASQRDPGTKPIMKFEDSVLFVPASYLKIHGNKWNSHAEAP